MARRARATSRSVRCAPRPGRAPSCCAPACTSRRRSMTTDSTARGQAARTDATQFVALGRKPVGRAASLVLAEAAPGRTACIRTFGCQMNVHDSDRMRRMVLDAGYREVSRYEDADVVVLNTCYVRENAVDRVRGHLGELSRLKREGRVKRVALTG